MKNEPRGDSKAEPLFDRVILLLLFALFMLLSPIVEWWAADDSPWYAPYLVWALLIALTYSLRRCIARQQPRKSGNND